MSTIDSSGTNQPTGSEPNRSGDSNDGALALIGRLKSFLVKAEQELANWLHHPSAAAANQHIQDAKQHLDACVGNAQDLDALEAARKAAVAAAQAPETVAAETAAAEGTDAPSAQQENAQQ